MGKKIGITFSGMVPHLIELDQSVPLAAVIKDLCSHWGLSSPDDYALQWEDSKCVFVTERNRIEIISGHVLKLTESPAKMVTMVIDKLAKGSSEELHGELSKMADMTTDITYAQEFVNKDGLKILIGKIEDKTVSSTALGYALKSFVQIMDHEIVSWDIIEPKFIKVVASSVNITRHTTADATTLQMALEILESVVTHSSGKYATVEQIVTPVTLTDHLAKTQNPETQKKALALINALFLQADHTKRKKIAESIQSKSIRTIILNNVIRRTGVSSVVDGHMMTQHQMDTEMLHELYVLQCLLLNLLEEKMMKKADTNDQNTLKDILELRRLAFDPEGHNESGNRRPNFANQYKKLGFKNRTNPVEDFTKVPPGILTLINMVYFAKHHQEEYTKVILENTTRDDDHDLPFVWASIELTRVLCEILEIGVPPTEEGQVFYPMLFTNDKPFAELYSIGIQLLNKTWKEMRAAAADFPKVLEVAREQIIRTLKKSSDNFDRFRTMLWSLSYSEITKIWQEERKVKEQGDSQARPIVELRERIKPEMSELIKQQRLAYLTEGSQFYNKSGRRGERFWFCCLSPNHKVFYYGECEENVKPTIGQLKNKLPVIDMKRLLTGKDCPHVKEKRKAQTMVSLYFSIQTEAELGEPLNFTAPDAETFNMWTDGINALLGNPMTSDLTNQELEMLLSMEIKLRLLDTEGITIPETPPPIPDDPPNYDFAYNNV